MFDKLKELKNLQEQAKKMQADLATERVTTSESGVIITMDGNMQIIDIEIADHLLTLENKNKLQVAIRQAHKSAIDRVQKKMAERMKQGGGLNLPGF
tara:strand:- start:6 stop:296 length:291 start_codon:yes stop_codon:yes gene_type:complete